MSKPDNTQAELRKLDSVRAINKLMIDAEIKVGHREQHIDYIVQEVLDWHNKQTFELLDRLDKETERCQDGCWVSIKD